MSTNASVSVHALGIVSAVFTIITRISISASFGGAGRCQTDPNSTPTSILLFVFSWVASVVAVVLLLTGAVSLNSSSSGRDAQPDTFGFLSCPVVMPGIFAAGGSFAFLSLFFGTGAYVTLTPASQSTTNLVAFTTTDATINVVDPERNGSNNR